MAYIPVFKENKSKKLGFICVHLFYNVIFVFPAFF